MDGGQYCLTFPSGCAAISDVLHLLKGGDHILCCLELYGGARTLFRHHAERHGIEVDFVDMIDASSIPNAIKPNTKVS